MESAAQVIDAPDGTSRTDRGEARGRRRYAPLFLGLVLAAVFLAVVDRGVSYERPLLLLILNALFYQGVAVFVSVRFAAIFLRDGVPGILLLACGVAIWGVSGLLGAIVAIFPEEAGRFDANALVTIHNCCVWAAALCHLAAVLLASLSGSTVARGRASWLCCGYGAVVLVALLIATAVKGDLLPPFFTVGDGGTTVRQVVVASAVAMFALAALLLRQRLEQPVSKAALW